MNQLSGQILEKYSNIRFHDNPSSSSWDVPRWQTNMTKLVVAFRNFSNGPEKKIKQVQSTTVLLKM